MWQVCETELVEVLSQKLSELESMTATHLHRVAEVEHWVENRMRKFGGILGAAQLANM